MKKELENKLKKKFPSLYKNLYKENTCMQWGIECDDGWYDLIYNLSSELDSWCKQNKLQVNAAQIKEKFGTLRFYFNSANVFTNNQYEEISSIVYKYEKLSGTVCELTGNVGELKVKGYWYKTLCKESAILLGYEDIKKKD